jgi:regulator of sirC expression with transglutaminase-like and TPR domain
MSSPFAGNIEFHKLLAGQTDVDLPRLMLEFAADAYPQLDESVCLAELDRLGRLAANELARPPGSMSLDSRLAAVSRLLYERQGFHGNDEQYYDPRNSYLNEVLERRLGIPISLGIVYMAVAARVDLQVDGVCTPGHFVLSCGDDEERWFVDPFSAGEVLSLENCRQRVESRLGENQVLTEQHFRPATILEVAARVLRNLKAAYAMENRWTELVPVQRRLAALLPDLPDERRDLGLVYLRTGEALQALDLLNEHLKDCPPDEAQTLAPYVRSARRMIAERN